MTQRLSIATPILALLMSVCLPAQAQNGATQQGPPKDTQIAACTLSDEDYAVFTALLQGLGKPEHPEEAWKNREILVIDATGAGEVEPEQWNAWGFRSPSNAAPSAETRADYESKSNDHCPLKENWGDPTLYKPLSAKEMEQLFDRNRKQHDGWQDFYRAHPNAAGFWTFSRPGYNNLKNEALLYVSHNCGWLCGTGHLYLLTKEDGHWKVKNRLFLWIS